MRQNALEIIIPIEIFFLVFFSQILDISDDSPRVRVYFFGEYSLGQVFKSQLYDFETYYKNEYHYKEESKQSKKSSLKHKAVTEALIHLGL